MLALSVEWNQNGKAELFVVVGVFLAVVLLGGLIFAYRIRVGEVQDWTRWANRLCNMFSEFQHLRGELSWGESHFREAVDRLLSRQLRKIRELEREVETLSTLEREQYAHLKKIHKDIERLIARQNKESSQ